MVHLVGERHVEMLVKGLEMYKLTHILRSETRARKFNQNAHHNLTYEGPFAEYEIDELVVTSPEHATMPAIAQLMPRLTKNSTLLLCHDLPGLAPKVASLWRKDPPKILVGLFGNSVANIGRKSDTLTISSPRLEKNNTLATKILNSTTGWLAEWSPYRELRLTQLENLVVQSTIEPLSIILDCDPRDLADPQYSHIIYQLTAESCQILLGYYNEPLIEPMRLQRLVKDQASMYPRKFELKNALSTRSAAPIIYLNGQLCVMAKSKNLPCPFNTMFRNMIQAKALVHNDMKL